MLQFLIFCFIFIWPIISTFALLVRKKNRFVKKISDEDLEAFRKLFAFVTIFVAGFICLFSAIDMTEPFLADFVFEIIFFDFLSAIFFLIAGKWILGLLGVIFFSSHMGIVTDILLSNLIPQWLIIICILLYPITSWLQFKQVILPMEQIGVKGD